MNENEINALSRRIVFLWSKLRKTKGTGFDIHVELEKGLDLWNNQPGLYEREIAEWYLEKNKKALNET